MGEGSTDSLAGLTDSQRAQAWERWLVLRPAVEHGVVLTAAADAASVPRRTAQRWMAAYRSGGLAALARPRRSDAGTRRTRPELVALIEGLALRRPAPSVATIARRAEQAAREQGWEAPSYSTVYAIVSTLDPALVTLALEGSAAFRDRHELVYRRRADRPNAIWQADHTQLDIVVLDADGRPARPWLTVILDDYSRAIAGYSVFLGAPSALNLSLALRQAIWVKGDSRWVVHGIPEVVHVDHGSDFTSHHLAQVSADLHFQIIYSAVARPQGRGKLERLFGTITSSLLPELPGRLTGGAAASAPRLSLHDLDAAIGHWIHERYHPKAHSETREEPQQAWLSDGWLPRTTERLSDLDELLVMVAAPRVVHRDGIRFQGLRYIDPTLAPYVGQDVTIRYDPRDVTEVRVFHKGRFLCRAISPQHAGQAISLKDIQAARTAHRRALRAEINVRRSAVAEYLPRTAPEAAQASRPAAASDPVKRELAAPPGPALHLYAEDLIATPPTDEAGPPS